jgi:hypothetical protein
MALGLLLVAAAVMLSVFNPGGTKDGAGADGTGFVGGIHRCYVEYDRPTAFVSRLQNSVDPKLFGKIVFRPRAANEIGGLATYEPGTGAIQIRSGETAGGRAELRFWIWHPEGESTAMAPYEAWFWKEARRALQQEAERTVGKPLPSIEFGDDDLWAVRESFRTLDQQAQGRMPQVTIERAALGAKPLDVRSAIATGMVVFALYFSCVYLLPTLNCEERERGVLLAQALSPASPLEILAAKFLFYPTFGILLAAILAGIYKPSVLTTLFFWLAIVAMAAAFLGIGMTVAAIARTQRAAFLGSMCYLLSVSLILFICSMNNIPFVSLLAVEYHGPRILHAAVAGPVEPRHWLHLLAAAGLAVAWISAAAWFFRRRGWQ